MDLRQIREALAAQVAAELSRPTTVYAQDPGSSRQPPCIVIEPGEPYVDYHTTFGNALCEIQLEVTLHVVTDATSTQVALDDYCSDASSSSIRAAIEAGRDHVNGALNGLADEVVCYRSHRPREATDTNATTVTFDVMVLARREIV